MTGSTMVWIALAFGAVFIEALTRTFTLLALAMGFGMAALFAWMGFGLVFEVIIAVVVSGGCVMWLRRSSTGQALHEAEESRYSVMDDDGDEVHVSQWDSGDSVDVTFKGRAWEAKLAKGSLAHPGPYKVREVREGKLILEERDR